MSCDKQLFDVIICSKQSKELPVKMVIPQLSFGIYTSLHKNTLSLKLKKNSTSTVVDWKKSLQHHLVDL